MRIEENYTARNIWGRATIACSLFCLFQKYAAISAFSPHCFNNIDPILEEFRNTTPFNALLLNEDFLSSRLPDLIATSSLGAVNSLSRKDQKIYKKNPSSKDKLIEENFRARFEKGLDRELSILQWRKNRTITMVTTYILKESDNPETHYGKLAADNHLAYAKHWGLNWRIVTDNLLKGKCTLQNGTVTDCVPYWNKIEVSRDWLKEPADPKKEEWLGIPDHDVLFTNMTVNPDEALDLLRKGLNTSIIVGKCSAKSKEENDFNCWKNGDPDLSIGTGVIFMRKDPQSKEFFDRVWAKRDDPTSSKNSICSTLGTCQTQEFLHEQEAFARVLEESRSLLNTVVTAVSGRETYQGKVLPALGSGKREGCFILTNPRPGEIAGPASFYLDNTHPEGIWGVGDWMGHTAGLPVKALDCETKELTYFREKYLRAMIKATIPIDTPDFSATKETSKRTDRVWMDLLSRVSIGSQEYALIDAARKDDGASVERLLKTGSILDQYRVWSILAAASNGNIDSLELLLRNGPKIPDQCRGPAMIRAAEKGHKEIAIRLFKDGSIFDKDLYQAVRQAAVIGHTDVLDFLLRTKVIPKMHLGLIVVETAKTFHTGSLEILLEYGVISERHRGQAVWRASMRGCTNTVKALLQNGPIPSIYRNSAINAAIRKNHPGIAELLAHS